MSDIYKMFISGICIHRTNAFLFLLSYLIYGFLQKNKRPDFHKEYWARGTGYGHHNRPGKKGTTEKVKTDKFSKLDTTHEIQ